MKIPKNFKEVKDFLSLKHDLSHNFLSNLSHNIDTANGNLTLIGFGNSRDQANDAKLIEEGYEKNAQAYSIIRKISESGSDIPWILEEVKSDGTAELVEEGRFAEFLKMPNPEQTQKDFKEVSNTYFLTSGDVFWNRVESVGFPTTELKTLPSQLTEVLSNNSQPLTPTGYQFALGKIKENYSLEEIIHLQYCNPTTKGIESLRGLSPLMAGWLTLSGDNQRAEAQESMLRNRGAAGIITNKSGNIMGEPDRKTQQGLLDKMFGGSKKFNSVVVGKSDAGFIQLGMSSSDLEILKTGIQNLRAICNIYGAPSELFNDPANKTFANQKTALKAFYENAVLPVDRRMLSRYNMTITKEWSKFDNKNYRVVQDLSHIGALQEDEDKKAARAEKITNSIMKVVTQVSQGLSPEAAAAIISHTHGLTEDESMKFVTLNIKKDGEGV